MCVPCDGVLESLKQVHCTYAVECSFLLPRRMSGTAFPPNGAGSVAGSQPYQSWRSYPSQNSVPRGPPSSSGQMLHLPPSSLHQVHTCVLGAHTVRYRYILRIYVVHVQYMYAAQCKAIPNCVPVSSPPSASVFVGHRIWETVLRTIVWHTVCVKTNFYRATSSSK